jgi:hypothetical protein
LKIELAQLQATLSELRQTFAADRERRAVGELPALPRRSDLN